MTADPDRFRCVRFEARMSRQACALRFHAAIQRFAPVPLQGCLGCPLGPLHVGLVPAEALTRRRTPQDRFRAYENARAPKRRAELRPDPVQR